MLEGIILIVSGLGSMLVLAFTSYSSKSRRVRVLFWIALSIAAGVVVFSGIETIRSNWVVEALQQRLRPRELSPTDISETARTLRAEGSFKVRIIRGTGDTEAARLTEQLNAAFVQAGWTVETDLVDLTGTPHFGLNIYASQNPPNTAVVALHNCLKRKNLDFKLIRDINLPPDVIGIDVGSKER